MLRRRPPRKVTYFEPVRPRLAPNTIIESTFEVGRRFSCTMRVDCGQLDPGAVIRPAEVAERKRTEQELIKARQQVPAANGARVCPSVSTRRSLLTGVPRSMKMGTIRSPCPYDAAARPALQSVNLRLPAILHYASCAPGFPILQGSPVSLR